MTLMDQLATHVNHGDHLCVVCASEKERLHVAAQYIADGLARNEFVMYAAEEAVAQRIRLLLEERGVDVAGAERRGALKLPTAEIAYLRNGSFNPDSMYAEFDRTIEQALAAGFTGCRFAGEPNWAIRDDRLRPALIEFEARLNGLFRQRKAAGLCVYDRKAWPAAVIRDVLRTHPVAVVDDLVCKRNLYYERPDLLDHDGSAEQQVSWMLSQLRELRLQEARLQIALEAGRLGSWELDLVTDTSTRSLQHDQIFGYQRMLPDWGYARFMEHVLPEDRERVDSALREALQSGSTWHFECRIRRHGDGAVRWIEAYGRPDTQRAPDGSIQRLLGIVADITDRKEMEQALREADRRKDEFLATLSHELRNPLAPILSALQFIRLRSGSDPQLQRMQDVIERQVRHLGRLVDDLLDVSRISTGRIVLKRERVELRAVLGSAVEAAQPLLDAGGHHLSMHLPEQPVHLEGDAVRLTQVFLNLLNNAAKYTPHGGRVEVSARRDGDHVQVRVRDNGIGIRAEMLPEIFLMFVQGHRSGEGGQGGLGIGLPLARKLVELHGGSIEARSPGPGEGSEFIVRLPALSEPPAQEPRAQQAARAGIRRRVLVVDDNVDAADTLAMTLELFGCEVQVRYDATSAFAAAAEFGADVAILDIGLPDMEGYELARRLRQRQPELKLVALTGWGQERDRARALEAGFDLHRTKPCDVEELLKAFDALAPGAATR